MVTKTLNRSLMSHHEGHRRKWLLPIDGQPPLRSPKTISQCILSLEKTFLIKNYDLKFQLRYRGDLLTRLRGRLVSRRQNVTTTQKKSVSFKSDQPLYETEWTHMLTEPNENKSLLFFSTTREMRRHENMAFYSS